MFSAVFVFQVFPILKVPNKFPENYIKNQSTRSFRNNQVGAGGDPPGPQAPWWRGQGGAMPKGRLGPWCPLPPIFSPQRGNPRERTLFPYLSSVPLLPPF